jgi:hypothetical protein
MQLCINNERGPIIDRLQAISVITKIDYIA